MIADVPPEARQRLPLYAVLVLLAAASRAAAALLLVPLLSALFSAGPSAALPWLGAVAIAVAAGWLAEWRLIGRAFDVGFMIAITTNEKLIDHLMSVSIGWLNATRQGEAKRALAGAVPELFAAFVNLGGQVGIAVVLPALIGFGLLFVAWPLGVVALIAVPLLFGALLLGARLMRRAEAAFAAASTEAAMRTDEFARAQVVLRAAGRSGTDGTPLGDAIEAQRQTGLRMLWSTLPGTLVFSVVLQSVLVTMVAVLALMFARGALTAVETVALIVVITRYLEPFNTLSDLFPALESACGGARRVQDVLAAPALPAAVTDAVAGPPSVEFRDVTFAPDGHAVLDGISFTVPAGTTTAIVGPSGAGKSTILSLVARFHEVEGGAVLVAGHDVRAYRPGTLMAQLAVVFQNVQLFEGTIADNIRIARPDAGDSEVRAAAAAARVDEIVARLGGWDAPVGEGGGALSGGERQRVSIARALLKNAPILLLDEATSALDTGNETAIAAALQGFARHTVLMVAHRIETIAHADTIIFVEGGRVVESGPREALIARDGRFAAYWKQRRMAREWRLDGSHDDVMDLVGETSA
jgi:ATP-binding cassette, subfamily B, bacterial IrtB/YbtQ